MTGVPGPFLVAAANNEFTHDDNNDDLKKKILLYWKGPFHIALWFSFQNI